MCDIIKKKTPYKNTDILDRQADKMAKNEMKWCLFFCGDDDENRKKNSADVNMCVCMCVCMWFERS